MKKKLPIYQEVSNKIDDLNKLLDKSKLACKNGCAHCCYQPVDISNEEAKVIFNYIIKYNDKATLLKLFEKSEKNGKIYGKGDARLPCMFLTEGNTCGVYNVRPFQCRRYYSYSVEVCKGFLFDREIFEKHPSSFDNEIDEKFYNEIAAKFLNTQERTELHIKFFSLLKIYLENI